MKTCKIYLETYNIQSSFHIDLSDSEIKLMKDIERATKELNNCLRIVVKK